MNSKPCPECGELNNPSFRFCKRCGILLTEPLPDEVSQTQHQMPHKAIGQMGRHGKTWLSFYNPFTGFGQRGRFIQWLISNLGNRANLLRETFTNRLAERQIPDAKISLARLSGRGLLTETRDYYIVRRKTTSVNVLISRFGKDLYISLVTYYKGPISWARVFILLLMLLFASGVILTAYLAINDEFESRIGQQPTVLETPPPQTNPLDYLDQENIESMQRDFWQTLQDLFTYAFLSLCCLFPLVLVDIILLILAFGYSVYKGITDLDFFSLLRSPPNEFQMDDIAALETAVEDTVRQALDQTGIDSALLKPAIGSNWSSRLI